MGEVCAAVSRQGIPGRRGKENKVPDTFKEGTFKGQATFSVLTGINKQTEEEYWFTFGLKKAQAVLENIDRLRKWVDDQENHRNHT